MDLQFIEITRDNWEQCIRLKVPRAQVKFMPSNVYALAESKFLTERVPLGVFDGKTMVGMVVCSYAPEHGRAWIHRLMIGQEFPNKGYTRLTMVRLLQRLAKLPGCNVIGVDYRPENTIMEQFYDAFGFRKTGQLTGTGDVVACLRLSEALPDALAPLLSTVPPQVADVQPEPPGPTAEEDEFELELLSADDRL